MISSSRKQDIEEVKSDFISIAAHQLRTPLSALKWFFTLMLDGDAGKLTKKQMALFASAYDRVNQLIEIVNNLLDISEIEEGHSAYTFAKGDILALVREIVADRTVNAQQKNIILQMKPVSTSALPAIMIDHGKIQIALQNILDNAIKYSPPQSTVRITVTRDKNRMCVQIADHGIGIPEEEYDRIYEKFFRGTNAKEHEPTGSGLGMYIVRNIIEKHHGTIAFTSKVHHGTTFTIFLPLRQQ